MTKDFLSNFVREHKCDATIVRYVQNMKRVHMLFHSFGQHMRFGYFLHCRATNAQVNLCQSTGLSELLLLSNIKYYIDKDSNQTSDLQSRCICKNVRLKETFAHIQLATRNNIFPMVVYHRLLLAVNYALPYLALFAIN